VLPGLLGTIQATETLKLVLGIGDSLAGRLLLVDALGMTFRSVRVPRDPACRMCGTREITTLMDYDAYCGTPAPGASEVAELSPRALAARLAAGDDLDLIDVREPHEWAEGHIAGARLVPLGTLAGAIPGLDASREVVVYCRSGMRSANAARQLRAAGLRVASLAGGILRWDDEVG
jgi:adenylyltransferase/sulfurtransferase